MEIVDGIRPHLGKMPGSRCVHSSDCATSQSHGDISSLWGELDSVRHEIANYLLHSEAIDVQHELRTSSSVDYCLLTNRRGPTLFDSTICIDPIVLRSLHQIFDVKMNALLQCHVLVGFQSARENFLQRSERQFKFEGARVQVLVMKHVVQDFDGGVASREDVVQQV